MHFSLHNRLLQMNYDPNMYLYVYVYVFIYVCIYVYIEYVVYV